MNVLIAAGGTGGHLIPALAAGEEFRLRGHNVSFVGSGRPLDRHMEKTSGMSWRHIGSGRLKGTSFPDKIKSLVMMPYAILRALTVIIQSKPDLVLGMGGYSTGPVVISARFLGIKVAILEQNRVPGLANRILSIFANRIFIAFPDTRFLFTKKVRHTGNPIPQKTKRDFEEHTKPDKFTLLVFGGSQGASYLNNLMIDSLEGLEKISPGIRIIHITGENDFDRVKTGYRKYPGLDATILSFTDQMGRFHKEADLVLGRAGASTITDLVTFGRASILVPYPFAADNHQEANARYLADAGASILKKELASQDLLKMVGEWTSNRGVLDAMAKRARSLATDFSEKRIVDECERLMECYV